MTKIVKGKVGDRVIMTSHPYYPESPSNPQGVEGIITELYSKGHYKVKWDNHTSNSGYKIPRDLTLVQEKVTLDPSIEVSIANLIMLEDVDTAHKKESKGWFKSILSLFGDSSDPSDFFSRYETSYKNTTGSKSMPTAYRTAKSVIMNGYELSLPLWGDDAKSPMGKTSIEKSIKESRKSKESVPLTNEELLGTIIKACDSIKSSYGAMIYKSPEALAAKDYIRRLHNEIKP